MDIYFGRIQALAQSDKLESRVRFSLQVRTRPCWARRFRIASHIICWQL